MGIVPARIEMARETSNHPGEVVTASWRNRVRNADIRALVVMTIGDMSLELNYSL